ncbi:MAG: RsmE family RNA methyltransferase [bacterium]
MSSIQRFYISDRISVSGVVFSAEQTLQISKVLRLQVGDSVTVFDGSGKEYLVELIQVERRKVIGNIVNDVVTDTELPVTIRLFHGLLKNKAQAFLLQKAAELGVQEFFPFTSSRNSNKHLGKEHFEKVLVEACEIAGGVCVPKLHEERSFAELFLDKSLFAVEKSVSLLAWEEEGVSTIVSADVLGNNQVINLLIGCEGGFSPEEVALAKRNNVHIVSLGKRILRAETAGVVFVSSVLVKLGLI